AWKIWLYYLPTQLFLLGVGSCLWLKQRHSVAFSISPSLVAKMGLLTCVFAVSILVEDSFVIFRMDQYTQMRVFIHNRNFSEDLLTVLYAGTTIVTIFHQLLQKSTGEKLAEEKEVSP